MPRVEPAVAALPGEERVLRAAEKALNGQTRGLRALVPFLGPAFVAAVAYVDPGNFATNIAGGAQYGYMLLWVVLTANLMAMLIQSMSAKLGIATGLNLAEVCREKFPRRVTFGLWIQAEVIAMATDLAEFIGAAIGIHLLFPGVPLFVAGVITAFAAFGILAIQSRGFRGFEAVIAALVHSRSSSPDRRWAEWSPASSHPGLMEPKAFYSGPASSVRRSCLTSSTCTQRSHSGESSG